MYPRNGVTLFVRISALPERTATAGYCVPSIWLIDTMFFSTHGALHTGQTAFPRSMYFLMLSV